MKNDIPTKKKWVFRRIDNNRSRFREKWIAGIVFDGYEHLVNWYVEAAFKYKGCKYVGGAVVNSERQELLRDDTFYSI